MRLGSSLRRRRRRERGAGVSVKLVLLGLALVALGGGGGYLLATEVLFPTPELSEELAEVPHLHGLERERAVERIRDLGLVVAGVDTVGHPSLPAGTVVGQSPVAGQMVVPGDSVRMTLSLGPEERPVPDVVRLRGAEARAVLEATGFRVDVDSVESRRPRGTVLAVEPEPGTELTLPGDVRIEVSLGPPQVRMPLLVGLTEEEALGRLDSLGLAVSEVAARPLVGVDAGLVVDQEPEAGTTLERGSAVRIVVGRSGAARGTFQLLNP